jgi:hypothetical protein
MSSISISIAYETEDCIGVYERGDGWASLRDEPAELADEIRAHPDYVPFEQLNLPMGVADVD